MAAFSVTTQQEIPYFTCQPLLTHEHILHAFSTRLGGVSNFPYTSLNLGFGSGDERMLVQENRRRFSRAVGFDGDTLVVLRQVHGNQVAIFSSRADAPSLRGSPGDALITDRPHLPLAVITADCFPIVLMAPSRPAVGIVHSGRQGTAAHVVPAALELMCRTYHLSPAEIFAAVGPGIGSCCYEVDQISAEAFLSQFSAADGLHRPSRPGHYYLDLQRAILQQLEAIGVPGSQVWAAQLCTACHPQWFYSYRRDGQRSGRMLNVVMLR